jgi:DNA primase
MELKELIREASPIEEIASQYTQLSRDGAKRLKGLCLFHTETAPSFTIYPETQSWHCFGCGRGGDVFDLVMARENLLFPEALRYLAKRANVPFPSSSPEDLRQAEEERDVQDALSVATEFYHQQLVGDTPLAHWCWDYLHKRGVASESIQELKLGVASGSSLLDYLRSQGIKEEIALRAGLVKDHDGELVDFFKERIIFPCLRHGRTVWLVGRAIGNSLPKYLGLPTPKSLYTSTMRMGQPAVILVEGPFDAIALWQWGYSTTALMGITIKDEWLPQFEKFNTVYICLDSDASGKEAAPVVAEKLGMESRLAQLPDGVDDPADFVEKGHTRDEFERLLTEAQDIVEYQIDQIPSDIDRLRLPDRLRPIMGQLAELEPAKAEAYLKYRIAPRFKLKERELSAYRSTLSYLRREHREMARVEKDKVLMQSEALEVKPDEEKVDPALLEEANRLLQNPALLYLAGELIQRLGVAGEGTNIRILYLTFTSRILDNPISVSLKSDSSGGKSYVVLKVLIVFPASAYLAITGMSRQALIYREESFSHRAIVIFERPGMDAADYNIRTLQSEGKLVFEVVEKDPVTNRWETRRVEKEGPTNFVFTTTSPELYPENETRHWSLLMDESPRQTMAAKLESARRYLGGSGVSEEELAVWHQIQVELQPLKVHIPYAAWLAEHTPNQPLRMRRDFNRLLALIEVVALLHQKQRQVKDGVIEAGLADYFMARELADQVFPASLSRINKKVEALVQEVEKIYQEKRAKGEADPVVKPSEIANALEVNAASVSRWLRPAVEIGLVEVVSETAKGYIRSVRPGNVTPKVSKALPTLEELAEAFPELAKGFKAVHPLTGEELTLEEETVTACVKKSQGTVVQQ